jgi:hypothetical protein
MGMVDEVLVILAEMDRDVAGCDAAMGGMAEQERHRFVTERPLKTAQLSLFVRFVVIANETH